MAKVRVAGSNSVVRSRLVRSRRPLQKESPCKGAERDQEGPSQSANASSVSFPALETLEAVPSSDRLADPILPIVMPMEELPLADVRNRLSELVADVEQTHARVTITKHGHPAAVLISPDDLAAIEETLEILSDARSMAEIREAEAEIARGEYTSAEEMARVIEERLRRESGAA